MPVSVYIDEDWAQIYKNPQVRVKCAKEGCETLLTAKRMSRSGLRFFAIRSGGCSHNEVAIPVSDNDIERDASSMTDGGGPESDEHRWMKGRFFKIARALDLDAIIEHAPTHADVHLTDARLALEYQRWDTAFTGRTRARSIAGARTIWCFPELDADATDAKSRAFKVQVFQHGAVFVSVRNKDNQAERLFPWENATQNRSARLYVSGSIAKYDGQRNCLTWGRLSMATFLKEVTDGTRVLTLARITSRKGVATRQLVWVRSTDLDRVDRPTASPSPQLEPTPAPEVHPQPNTIASPVEQESADVKPPGHAEGSRTLELAANANTKRPAPGYAKVLPQRRWHQRGLVGWLLTTLGLRRR